jgi:hypothetical protein
MWRVWEQGDASTAKRWGDGAVQLRDHLRALEGTLAPKHANSACPGRTGTVLDGRPHACL